MRRRSRLLSLLAATMLAALPSTIAAQDASPAASPGAEPSFLFVASGTSATVADGAITLIDAPLVIAFEDRPGRSAGHVTAAGFIEGWGLGENSFAADPPNAALISADPVLEAIVELTSAELTDDGMRFGYRLVEGELPDGDLGPTSLVIDEHEGCFPFTPGTWVMWISFYPPVWVPCPT